MELRGALRRAQELGYAERNPETDIEGYDTCRKIAILTAVATGKEVNYEEIPTQGINKDHLHGFQLCGTYGGGDQAPRNQRE